MGVHGVESVPAVGDTLQDHGDHAGASANEFRTWPRGQTIGEWLR